MAGGLKQKRIGLGSLMEWFLNNVMETEAAIQTEAEFYRRTGNRQAYRNGFKSKNT